MQSTVARRSGSDVWWCSVGAGCVWFVVSESVMKFRCGAAGEW